MRAGALEKPDEIVGPISQLDWLRSDGARSRARIAIDSGPFIPDRVGYLPAPLTTADINASDPRVVRGVEAYFAHRNIAGRKFNQYLPAAELLRQQATCSADRSRHDQPRRAAAAEDQRPAYLVSTASQQADMAIRATGSPPLAVSPSQPDARGVPQLR